MEDEAIKLPEPTFWVAAPPRGGLVLTEVQPSAWEAHPVFTADQVRAAVLAERERIAALCDAQHFGGQRDDDLSWTACAAHLAAAIRSGHSITETARPEE